MFWQRSSVCSCATGEIENAAQSCGSLKRLRSKFSIYVTFKIEVCDVIGMVRLQALVLATGHQPTRHYCGPPFASQYGELSFPHLCSHCACSAFYACHFARTLGARSPSYLQLLTIPPRLTSLALSRTLEKLEQPIYCVRGYRGGRAPIMAPRGLAARFLLLLALLCSAFHADARNPRINQQRRSFALRIESRDRDWGRPSERRSLLRNVTVPLHGAVKDYG